ncbi:MAG: hypothetical protein RIF32_10455 [Leptospirales bacterium]|jgi:hypothetical protein
MKHQYYHYRAHPGDEDGAELSAEALAVPEAVFEAALEATRDHARATFAGDIRDIAPPLPENAELAALCLREWHAVLDDLSCVVLVTEAMPRSGPDVGPGKTRAFGTPLARRIAFQVQRGVLALTPDHPWVAREAPVFRSAPRSPSPAAVVYSDIVALEEAYALLELRASDEELRLNISGGGKNDCKLYISLYTNGRLVEKSLLGTEVSWDLSDSEPGLYQLDCGDKPALSFQIQE